MAEQRFRRPDGARRRAPAGQRARRAEAVSCGGVLFRYGGGDDVEVLLVGRRHPALWTLPKGTPRPGETPEQTALREVEEETGVRGRVVAPIGSISYSFALPSRHRRFRKTVHHYLLAPISGDPTRHDAEYDLVRWMPAAEALVVLTHENERAIIRRALELLRRSVSSPEFRVSS